MYVLHIANIVTDTQKMSSNICFEIQKYFSGKKLASPGGIIDNNRKEVFL